MAHWRCKCGNEMNDINCPDENAYRVYPDTVWLETWEIIGNDKIGFGDFRDETYLVYKCPVCGRLMVGGESNRLLFYKPEFEDAELQAFLEAERAVPKETTQNWVEQYPKLCGKNKD